MLKNIPLNILILSIIAIVLGISIESQPPAQKEALLPWLIQQDTEGNTEVFGITLHKTSLQQIQDRFAAEGSITLFRSPEGIYALEVYFQRLYLSGLKADLILSMDITQQRAEEIFLSGVRISTQGDGTQKINLSPKDLEEIAQDSPFLITYLPAKNLDAALIKQRFGLPDEIIKVSDNVQHWLYPAKGLDIAYHPENKEVMQFISPRSFDRIVKLLHTDIATPQAID